MLFWSSPRRRKWPFKRPFISGRVAHLRHSLKATLALRHKLNHRRQERQEMASRGGRLAARAATTAVNQDTGSQSAANAEKSRTKPGVILRHRCLRVRSRFSTFLNAVNAVTEDDLVVMRDELRFLSHCIIGILLPCCV